MMTTTTTIIAQVQVLLYAVARTCAGQNLVLVVRLALLVGGLLHVQQRSTGHLARLEAALRRGVACTPSPPLTRRTQTWTMHRTVCHILSCDMLPDATLQNFMGPFQLQETIGIR